MKHSQMWVLFLFLFDVDLGLEHYSDISLTDHCLLRKLTVNLPLVAILLLITLTQLIACVISSHGNIPHTRNARVTGSSPVRGANLIKYALNTLCTSSSVGRATDS